MSDQVNLSEDFLNETYDRRIRTIDTFILSQITLTGGIFADLIVSMATDTLKKWLHRGRLTKTDLLRMVDLAASMRVINCDDANTLRNLSIQ